jgi:dolichyl-phosphate beta-glucosyltransferase
MWVFILGNLKTLTTKVIPTHLNPLGGAVMQGIMHSVGELILFADGDGATKFSDLDLLISEIEKIKKDGLGFAVGSRAHMVNSDAVVKRSFIRNVLMKCFAFFLY